MDEYGNTSKVDDIMCNVSDPKKLTVFGQLIFIIDFHHKIKYFLDKYNGKFVCDKKNLLPSFLSTTTEKKLEEIYNKIKDLYGSLYTKINDICDNECDIKKTIMELINDKNSIEILEEFHKLLNTGDIPSDEKHEVWFKTINKNSHIIREIYVTYCQDYTVPFHNDQIKFINLLYEKKCKKSSTSNSVKKPDLQDTPSQSSYETDNEQPATQQGGKRRKTRQRRRRRRNVTLKRRPRQKKYHRR